MEVEEKCLEVFDGKSSGHGGGVRESSFFSGWRLLC
jgi:hypothetical protein